MLVIATVIAFGAAIATYAGLITWEIIDGRSPHRSQQWFDEEFLEIVQKL